MARFDKFDAQRKAAVKTNGHAKTAKEESPVPLGSGGHSSLPVPKKQKIESEEEDLSDIKPTPSPRKHKQESDDDELSDVKDTPPPRKKKKNTDQDSDAAFAAKLQAQENSRIRSTRGGGPKATPVKKKKAPKKKTSAKVKAEDDSDLDGSGSGGGEKEVNRSGGFHV